MKKANIATKKSRRESIVDIVMAVGVVACLMTLFIIGLINTASEAEPRYTRQEWENIYQDPMYQGNTEKEGGRNIGE